MAGSALALPSDEEWRDWPVTSAVVEPNEDLPRGTVPCGAVHEWFIFLFFLFMLTNIGELVR